MSDKVIRVSEQHYLRLKQYSIKNKRTLKASVEIMIDRVAL